MSDQSEPGTLGARIFALRQKLGSVVRPLSRRDLAVLLSSDLPSDQAVAATSLERWEKNISEPPIAVLRVMARRAEVSFEEFALGPQPAAQSHELEVEEGETLEAAERRIRAEMDEEAQQAAREEAASRRAAQAGGRRQRPA